MPKSTSNHPIWERILRSIATNRLGWQINIRGDRKLLGVPEGTRQWIEFLIEEGFLGYGSAGSIEVKTPPSLSFMKRYEATVAARVEAAQRRTCRPIRPEDIKPNRPGEAIHLRVERILAGSGLARGSRDYYVSWGITPRVFCRLTGMVVEYAEKTALDLSKASPAAIILVAGQLWESHVAKHPKVAHSL